MKDIYLSGLQRLSDLDRLVISYARIPVVDLTVNFNTQAEHLKSCPDCRRHLERLGIDPSTLRALEPDKLN